MTHPWPGWDRHQVQVRDVEPVTGHLERDTLLAALVSVEARLGERRGWNQPPRLWTLHLPHLGQARIDLYVIPRRLWNPRGHPVDDLLTYAARMPRPRDGLPVVDFADSPGGFCGLAMMTEGYGVDQEHLTAQEMDRARAGERVALNHPDRAEIRCVTAVDINAYTYHVQRFRGQEPTRRVLDNGRGRVPSALGRITAALRPTRSAPPAP
ncbi:hypothetical protein [Nonomuraea sp. NPDC049646]|uniref:hypothetical protein n=1 Tax=unclassified Nonomuraea TaxID=2593643 RepID=UPI00379F70E2